jgi:hypothetical protein
MEQCNVYAHACMHVYASFKLYLVFFTSERIFSAADWLFIVLIHHGIYRYVIFDIIDISSTGITRFGTLKVQFVKELMCVKLQTLKG